MGTAAVQMSSHGSGVTMSANTNRYSPAGCGLTVIAFAVEFQGEVRWRTVGVWSDLWVRVTQNTFDLTSNAFSRINNTDGNQTVAIAALTTGFFHDAVNTDTIAAGDRVNYRVRPSHSVASVTGFKVSILQSIFTATAAERVYRLGSGEANTTGFFSCMGGGGSDPAESPWQIHVPGGTFRNGGVRVTASSRNGASTLVLRVNELNTALTISIAASTTGWFEDLVNTVTVFDRDRVNWSFTLGGTSGFYFTQVHTIDLVTTRFFGGGTRSGFGIHLKGSGLPKEANGFGPLTGWHEQETTESLSQAEALVTDTWEGIIVTVSTNGQDDTCEWRSRLNGADSTLTVTVAAFTTGIFESTGSSIAVTPTSLIGLRRLTNASNVDALIYYTHNLFGVGGAPPAATTLLGGIYQLVVDRTKDTLYTGFGPVTTQDNKIPNPFVKTGLVGD